MKKLLRKQFFHCQSTSQQETVPSWCNPHGVLMLKESSCYTTYIFICNTSLFRAQQSPTPLFRMNKLRMISSESHIPFLSLLLVVHAHKLSTKHIGAKSTSQMYFLFPWMRKLAKFILLQQSLKKRLQNSQ